MKKKEFYVYVAIGASAGGFEALSQLVANLKEKTGFYYFIAQHHAWTEQNILAGLLNRLGQFKVVTLESGMLFEPDVFYIIPPELRLISKRNKLVVEYTDVHAKSPLPNIDYLLDEICKIENSKIIAVLLSGSGTDGTKGMKSVKEQNGINIAQSPEDALFESMPKSAINEKIVDYILPVKDIAPKLVELSKAFTNGTYFTHEIPFDSIRKVLYKEKQLDLFKYKDETINRRIEKRMNLLNIKSIDQYARYIHNNQEELELLNREMLIGVTEFFRGPQTFQTLKKILLKKISDYKQNSEFRVWSVACSSGEEAYSIAILLNEVCEEIGKKLQIKIFATDIDENALEKARKGIYSKNALAKVDNDIVQKYFFKKDENLYQIKKELREQIVFAYHNFLQNPPFINLDLIVCRNILIYLVRSVQDEVFALFHFSLKSKGILFLGSSESMQSHVKLYTTLNSKYRIYEKEENVDTQHRKFTTELVKQLIKKSQISSGEQMQNIDPKIIEKHLKEDLFEYYRNGSLIIDRDYNIVYKKGTIPYMSFADGIFSLNIFQNLDELLHYDIRVLLKRVSLSNKLETTKFIQLPGEESEKFIQISAQPFCVEDYQPMILLNFQEIDTTNLQLNGTSSTKFSEDSVVSTLASQLEEAKEEIKNLSNELLFSKQNMDSVNVELQESNEKLQSTVEELETSNEELQSSNEELLVSLASNKELQNKLSLILDSSMNGVLGLDINGRHIFANEKAAELLGYSQEFLIGKDSHRLWHHTKPDGSYYPESECPINRVLHNGEEKRGEDLFWRSDGTSFPVEFVRSPIIEEGKITGAVVMFHDITKEKELELKSQHEQELINTYLDISGIIILILDKDANIVTVNKAGCNLLGMSKEKLIGLNWFDNFVSKKRLKETKKVFSSIINEEIKPVSHYINEIIDVNKESHLISWNNAIYRDENKNVIGIIATGNDITKEEYLESELRRTNLKYAQTFKAAQTGISQVALDGSWIDINEYLCNLLGYTRAELLKLTFSDVTHPDDVDKDMHYLKMMIEGTVNNYHTEKRYIRKNGDVIWVNLSVVLIRDEKDKPQYFISAINDISQIKLLTLELESKKNEFENIIRFAPNPMMLYSENGMIVMVNDAWQEITGYTKKDISTIEKFLEKASKKDSAFHKLNLDGLFKNNTRFDMGEVHIKTKDEQELVWLLSFSPLSNTYEGMRLIIASAMDITQMQRNEELMLAQSRQAAMGDMIGMIAHQWRQPLSIIGMVANNLKASLQLNDKISADEVEKLTDVLDEQTQFLSRTIDDFRTFFKPEKAKESISLCKIYEKLKTMIQKVMEDNHIKLNFTHSCDVEISTYPNELIQVLLNLINNAKDAVKEQNMQDAKIDVSTKIDADAIAIEVRDNAGGIDAKVFDRLGEPYVTTKNQNGTGLGIYMSLMIINKHFSGDIKWKNCDEGSCFTITLPLKYLQDGIKK